MKLADKIKFRLINFVSSNASDILIPNYYRGYYEMDLFKLTSAGFVYEYEIKISRSDFFADAKKGFKIWNSEEVKLKHNDILNGLRCNKFFFVVPENLVSKEEVPEYAGLIYYNEKRDYFDLIKNAKLLHKNKETNYREIALKLAFRSEILRRKLNTANYRIKQHNIPT